MLALNVFWFLLFAQFIFVRCVFISIFVSYACKPVCVRLMCDYTPAKNTQEYLFSLYIDMSICNGSVCIWKSSWQKSVLCLYDNYRSIQSDNQNKKCEFTFLRNNTWFPVVKKNIHNYNSSYHNSTTWLRHTLFSVKFAHCDTFDIVKAIHSCYSSFIFARSGILVDVFYCE